MGSNSHNAMAAAAAPLVSPAADAFVTNLRFGPNGLLYAWDGQQVWRQSGVNVDGNLERRVKVLG